MNNISPLFSDNNSTKEAIQQQASLWISKMDRGLNASEQNAFSLWVNQSIAHREILFKFASLWDDLTVLNELNSLFPLENQKNKKNKVKNVFIKYAVAASIILTITLVGHFNFFFNPSANGTNNQQYVEIKNFSTAVGQQSSFPLSDGSIIQLNTNSLVKIHFSKHKRLLTLVHGEARFQVAKDKTRPFTVTSGDKSFTALGTIFNVQKHSAKNMELVVTEGRVLITKATLVLDNIAQQLNKLPVEKLPGLLVTTGEKAVIENNIEEPIEHISYDQIQKDLSWQQGMLIFEGTPLNKALAEVSRYTNTHFEIADNDLATVKVAGYFKANDVDGLLKSLKNNFNINFKKTGTNSILLTRN